MILRRVIKMCKFYIYSTDRHNINTDILELSSSNEAKQIFSTIKKTSPQASLGVVGAKDMITFRRTHRNLGKHQIFKSPEEFIRKITLR